MNETTVLIKTFQKGYRIKRMEKFHIQIF